jgi:hypothetical protein
MFFTRVNPIFENLIHEVLFCSRMIYHRRNRPAMFSMAVHFSTVSARDKSTGYKTTPVETGFRNLIHEVLFCSRMIYHRRI